MIRIRQEVTKTGNPIYYFELDNSGQISLGATGLTFLANCRRAPTV